MADPILAPQFGDTILDNGVASQQFQNWMAQVSDQLNNTPPLAGSGSPEGVLTASVGRWYVDTVAGTIYYKQTGDGDTGWLLSS